MLKQPTPPALGYAHALSAGKKVEENLDRKAQANADILDGKKPDDAGDDLDVRDRAMRALSTLTKGRSNNQAVIAKNLLPVFELGLSDSDPAVRREARQALEEITGRFNESSTHIAQAARRVLEKHPQPAAPATGIPTAEAA